MFESELFHGEQWKTGKNRQVQSTVMEEKRCVIRRTGADSAEGENEEEKDRTLPAATAARPNGEMRGERQ